MKEEKPIENRNEHWWWFTLLLLLMVILWVASAWIINNHYQGDPVERGTFGDMFGAVNAFFSGGAFAGVIFAVLLQKRELSLQRKVMMQTREELERAAEAHEETLKIQSEQTRILLQTAKLNAYTAIVEVYNQELDKLYNVQERRPSKEIADKISIHIKHRNDYFINLTELSEALREGKSK